MLFISFFAFVVFWLFMLFYQCRSIKNFDGYISMRDYTFCSNLIFNFPGWLIWILFFNNRLTKIPLPIVLHQINNYFMFILSCVCKYFFSADDDFLFLLFKIWFSICILLFVVMCIDHEIFCFRKKRK